MAEEVEHVGFKTLGLVVGIILGAIYLILDILRNWITGTTWTHALSSIGFFGVLVIIIPLLCYFAHVLWRAFHVFEDLIG